MNWIKSIRIFLLILIIVGIGLLVTQKIWVPKVVEMILKNDKNELLIPSNFTELHFSIMSNENPQYQNKTSEIATSDIPLTKRITVHAPNDPRDARVSITDLVTGVECDTDNYLVTRLLISGDEKTLLLYHYSGSNNFLTTIDTVTCKTIVSDHKADPIVMTVDDAIGYVMRMPEVKQWMKLFNGSNGTNPSTGGRPAFMLDSETNDMYVVRVYENMPDHASTFGFYDVNKVNGRVTVEGDIFDACYGIPDGKCRE
ncbi:MAG: hypothetical protein V4473_01910 [Patescibacteria group bacterium]